MEIKATLNKPFAEQERMDFIVENNHRQGYEIKETETALEAWGLTEEEQAERTKQQKIDEYKRRLKEIDERSARSMRVKLAGTSTEEDDAFLAGLEEQAEAIRQRLNELNSELNHDL